ncbi:hypothetical protein AURDEDRAFT_112053 [Auricularia subglabra TFB-10046 SS5]|nr:hypothetical protein AURDEDRAFT_112053 [Auricularia subglabra TFB-10046 SS5]
MDCRVCEQRQRQFYCADCLRIHLREFRNNHARLSSELSAVVQRSEHLLKGIEPGRLERADGATLDASIAASHAERDRVRSDNERKRTRISHLRASIAARRQALSAARAQQAATPSSSSTPSPLAAQQAKAPKLAQELAQTRTLLAHHLLSVFQIQQVRGGEWSIGGLVLPVPGDMRRFPAEHINAALLHTLHFLRVLTFYLGIKLPFIVTFEAAAASSSASASPIAVPAGAGLPWIRAGQGPENGGWARWVHKQPLFIKPSTSSTSSSTSSSTLGTRQPAESFTTGLTMLMYNVAYLAHTQGLEVGLAQAGEVVGNLRALCFSPDFGRRSHETRPLLPPPTPPGFALDFAQLLQVTSAAPPPRRPHKDKDKDRRRASRHADDDDGWDFVEAES